MFKIELEDEEKCGRDNFQLRDFYFQRLRGESVVYSRN